MELVLVDEHIFLDCQVVVEDELGLLFGQVSYLNPLPLICPVVW